MPQENEQALIRTKKTVEFVSSAFRRSIRRLSSIGRRKEKEGENPPPILEVPLPSDSGAARKFFLASSDYRIRPKTRDTLIINDSTLPRFGSFRVKKRAMFTSRSQPLGTVRCELAHQDNHFSGYVSLTKVAAAMASSSSNAALINHDIEVEKGAEPRVNKLTSFEKRRRQNQDYGVALHAKQSLFCPEQASQIELEIITLTNRDFIVQISASNGEKSPPLSIQSSGLPARFSPSNVGCGHGVWRLEVFEREQAKFVPKTVTEINLRGCGLLVYEVLRSGELRLYDRLWLDVID